MQQLCPFISLHLAVSFTYVVHDLQRSWTWYSTSIWLRCHVSVYGFECYNNHIGTGLFCTWVGAAVISTIECIVLNERVYNMLSESSVTELEWNVHMDFERSATRNEWAKRRNDFDNMMVVIIFRYDSKFWFVDELSWPTIFVSWLVVNNRTHRDDWTFPAGAFRLFPDAHFLFGRELPVVHTSAVSFCTSPSACETLDAEKLCC